MVNFSPTFVADEGKADLQAVADHVDHIASITGRKQCVTYFTHKVRNTHLVRDFKSLGIGSDFDGIDSVPSGLEDVSKYPALVRTLFPLTISLFMFLYSTLARLLNCIVVVGHALSCPA